MIVEFDEFWKTAGLMALAAIPWVPVLLMFLHAARTPAWVWAFTSHTQANWVAVLLLGLVAIPIGLCLATWYFFRVRPELSSVERGNVGRSGSQTR